MSSQLVLAWDWSVRDVFFDSLNLLSPAIYLCLCVHFYTSNYQSILPFITYMCKTSKPQPSTSLSIPNAARRIWMTKKQVHIKSCLHLLISISRSFFLLGVLICKLSLDISLLLWTRHLCCCLFAWRLDSSSIDLCWFGGAFLWSWIWSLGFAVGAGFAAWENDSKLWRREKISDFDFEEGNREGENVEIYLRPSCTLRIYWGQSSWLYPVWLRRHRYQPDWERS